MSMPPFPFSFGEQPAEDPKGFSPPLFSFHHLSSDGSTGYGELPTGGDEGDEDDEGENEEEEQPVSCHPGDWSDFRVYPAPMSHMIAGLSLENRAAVLSMWYGSPTYPFTGRPCPTYMMDEKGVVDLMSRLRLLLNELRKLPLR